MKDVTIITDGSCLGNPGKGGWAAILLYNEVVRELTGSEPNTTNNRMELLAAIEGLIALKFPCRVTMIVDSEYVRLGITTWMAKWKQNGWMTSNRKPVQNKDLWEALDHAVNDLGHTITWQWVKGHAAHPMNNRADYLAQLAARSQK